MNNNAFSSLGATPKGNPVNFQFGTTPQAKALSYFAGNNQSSTPAYSPNTQSTPPSIPSMNTSDIISSMKRSGLLSSDFSANPTKTKVTTPDGHIVEQSYESPSKGGTTGTGSSGSGGSQNTGTTQNTPTFPGLIGQSATASNNAANAGASNVGTGTGILNNIATTPNPIATSAQGGLLDIAQNGSPAVDAANANLLKFQQQNPYMLAAQSNPNVAADVASGRTSLLGQVFGKEEQALATNAANQIAQEGQQITAGNNAGNLAYTGQGQQITAGTNIANTGTTGQGQGITGLGNVANAAAPQPYGLTTQPYNPLSDTYGGGGANGAIDRAKLAGQIDATQQTVSSQSQQVQQYKSSLKQGQNLQSQLGDLITNFGLNPSDINGVNSGLQKIAENTSSPQYQILQNYINDVANTYAQVLTPPGGSATDTTRAIATSMLDATAKGQSIIDVMKSLDQAAQAKIAGVTTIATNSSSGSSTGGNIFDF